MLSGNQQFPMQPQQEQEPGFLGWLNSPQGQSMMGGVGAGLLAKMQNRKDPVVPTVFAAADQYKKQMARKQFADALSNPAVMNNPEMRKQLGSYMINSDDPKLEEFGLKMMFGDKDSMKPYTLSPGQNRYDENNKLVVDRSKDVSPTKAGYAGAQALELFHQQLAKDNEIYNYGWDAKQTKIAGDRYLKGYKTMPDGTPLPELQGDADELANQVVKAGTNSQGMTSKRAAVMVDRILKTGDEQIDGAVKYAGLGGQGGLLVDRVKAGFGKGTPEYSDYIKFTRVTVPAAVNAAIKAEGANMSDDAKKLLINSLNPISWDTDFDTALEQYKYFQKLYGSEISPTTTMSQTDLSQSVKENAANYVVPPKPKLTEADIQYNMRTYHKTRSQVLQAGKAQGHIE